MSSESNTPQWSDDKKFVAPSKEELKKRLSSEQYTCTQEEGTERPFHNAFWNNKEDGIYIDVVSGEPLFLSIDKYDSGTGWPSFTKPIEASRVTTKTDHHLSIPRTEVRSTTAQSHLGHVFDDGPTDRGGKRYCINSAALGFVPLKEMAQKGYGRFLFQFAKIKNWEVATLAGGCFWGVEELFRKQSGVLETQVGYTGGTLSNPDYDHVKVGKTGHAEAVQILFDPKITSYEKILEFFFKIHDPTTMNQQGNDIGTQYRSAIFFEDEKQKKVAENVKARVSKSNVWKKSLVTEIQKKAEFWRAEDYHQKYLKKQPDGYTCHYVRELKF